MVGHDHIETLVIERGHQLGIDRLAFWIAHRESPLLLLSWFQTIAEGGPFQGQMLIRQGTANTGDMRIALAILHPCEIEQQSVAIALFIGNLQVQQLVALIYCTSLDHLITSEDAIDDVDIFC